MSIAWASVRGLLIDIAGTLEFKHQPIPGAIDAFCDLQEAGYHLRLLTNTDSKDPHTVLRILQGYGFPVTEPQIYTPIVALRDFIRRHPSHSYFLLTTRSVQHYLRTELAHKQKTSQTPQSSSQNQQSSQATFTSPPMASTRSPTTTLPHSPPNPTASSPPNTPPRSPPITPSLLFAGETLPTSFVPDYTVICDFSDDGQLEYLHQAFHCVTQGSQLLGSQGNRYYLDGQGRPRLDTGSLVRMISAATGSPYQILGKPSPTYFLNALKDMHLSPDQALIIGDDLESDIQGGIHAGIPSILVHTGKGSTLPPNQKVSITPSMEIGAFPEIIPYLRRSSQ